MGFHFDAQGEVGEDRSKTPKLPGRPLNYHAFLYSMSCKDSLHDQRHQSRLSLPPIKRRPVPPRQSSLPRFVPGSSPPENIPISDGRSVASMNNVLPLQLQPVVKAAGFDFSSWIESTIEELRHPFNSEDPAHNSRSPSMKEVPWMQEEQDITFSTLQPRKYREAAVYSDPESAIKSFPYCGCEGLGSSQYHKHSASADLNSMPPSPLFSKNKTLRCSGDTLVNSTDRRSGARIIDTFGRPRADSDESALSKKSEAQRASEAAWMQPLSAIEAAVPIPRIGDIISPTVFSPTTTEGCSSMPCTPGLRLDAHAARLSSATVVQVSPTASVISSFVDNGSRTSSRSATPPILEPLVMDYFGPGPTKSVSTTPINTPWEPRAKGGRGKLDDATTSTVMASQPSNVDLISPLCGFSDRTPQSNSAKPPSHRRKLSASAIAGIVADITASVQEFPERMLCLDTPCIVAIRHDLCRGGTSSLDGSPLASSAATVSIEANMKAAADATRPPAFHRQNSSVTRSRRVRKQLTPLPRSLRAGTPLPARTSSDSFARLLPDRYNSKMDMLSYYREDLTSSSAAETSDKTEAVEKLKVPDLSPIASIFPESDSWFQSTLYAHLTAYNYITSLNTILQARPSQGRRSRAVPDKAARTMGISSMATIEDDDNTYTRVMDNLEQCMVKIMKSMMGKREGISGLNSPGAVLGCEELALLRALCQVVRMADM